MLKVLGCRIHQLEEPAMVMLVLHLLVYGRKAPNACVDWSQGVDEPR